MFRRNGGNNHKAGSVITSLLVGGLVGAGLAMLFTPHSGKRMRRRITDMAEDARDYATHVQKNLSRIYSR
ncbi:MAG: YtxH domain-containing protein [Nitrospirota bacterium]